MQPTRRQLPSAFTHTLRERERERERGGEGRERERERQAEMDWTFDWCLLKIALPRNLAQWAESF